MTDSGPIIVDTLIAGATIVTMDVARTLIIDGALAIAGSTARWR